MKAIMLFGLCTALLAALRAAAAEEKGGGSGNADLAGDYALEGGEKDGKALPSARIVGSVVRFTKDRILVVDKDTKELYSATYKLDTAKAPWAISMTSQVEPSKGQVARGLIEKKGDTIRLIYSLPDTEAPTEFKTKANQHMFTMRKSDK